MRILALYNTRGMVGPLELLRNRHLEHCDLFVHCGNSMVDYQNEFIAGYVVIRGGDDFENHFLRDYILDIHDQKILMINNIDYRGTRGLEKLTEFVQGLYDKMSVVICATNEKGYSHFINHTLFVCPGDANNPLEHTYAIIETEDEGIRVSFFDIESGELKKMNYHEK